MAEAGGVVIQLKLPEGWIYKPRKLPKMCKHCHHIQPEVAGELQSPSGRIWPLVGNNSAAQEREMVKAIVEAHT